MAGSCGAFCSFCGKCGRRASDVFAAVEVPKVAPPGVAEEVPWDETSSTVGEDRVDDASSCEYKLRDEISSDD